MAKFRQLKNVAVMFNYYFKLITVTVFATDFWQRFKVNNIEETETYKRLDKV